jgi:hypothetical protein
MQFMIAFCVISLLFVVCRLMRGCFSGKNPYTTPQFLQALALCAVHSNSPCLIFYLATIMANLKNTPKKEYSESSEWPNHPKVLILK